MKQILYEGRFLQLVTTGRWEYVERTNASGVVVIVAITEDRKLLFVEQFRPPLNCRCIELPAGLAGDKGAESDLDAVKRELAEEAGYEAKGVFYLGHGTASPGLTSENAGMFLALGLKKLENPPKDESENIVLHEIALDEVPGWLREKRKEGLAVDWKAYVALFFAAATLGMPLPQLDNVPQMGKLV